THASRNEDDHRRPNAYQEDLAIRAEEVWRMERSQGLRGCPWGSLVMSREIAKRRFVYGIELLECHCGVWRVAEPSFACWKHEDREQLAVEAMAQLQQALRNFGYELAKAMRLRR